MNKHPVVSIVTPFFNTEKYLSECIESVINQTFSDWEYILVDNCSTDGSLDVATNYTRLDSRIRLIRNQKFLSQVENYNHAIYNISPLSKYCKIVQADDFIFPQCITEMVKAAENCRGSIALVGSYTLKGTFVEGAGTPFPRPLISGREACRLHLLESRYLFGSPTSVMYLASMVREKRPFYGYGSYMEDTEICYELLKEHDLAFVYQVLTFTRTGNESISSSVERFNPNLLNKYILLRKFGEHFLTPEEHMELLRKVTSEYYTYLGTKKLQGQDDEFWRYHRNGLRYIGDDITTAKMTYHTLCTVLRNLMNIRKMLGYFTS